jgi:GSCFA family
MIKFRSELDVKPQAQTIAYPDPILLVGSCFTEHMGERLSTYRLPVLQNPHGIVFNPVSISETIVSCLEGKRYTREDLFYLHERWNSWAHHSRFSHPDPDTCLQAINQSQQEAQAFLRKTKWIVLTLGSAWVYELKETGKVVANCHKAPADWFNHRLLTVEDLLSVLDNLLHRLFYTSKDLRIIFTISPVRHLREGMVENNRSKAALIQAVHHLVNKFDRIDYFPAYELVIDDLRDYRFYAEDLVHPNYQATQYVWEKFTGGFMSEQARDIMGALDPLLSARKHRPFNHQSEEHRKFLGKNLQAAKALMTKYPFLDLHEDLTYFAS